MRVLISNVVWGKRYAAIFARYTVASLLSHENLPELAKSASITFHIITTRRDQKRLLREPLIQALGLHCRIEWERMENFGIGKPPAGGAKYNFLSALQNVAIARAAKDQDAIVFNYADFIWTGGSLAGVVGLLNGNGKAIDAVLGFCPPVHRDSGMRELERFRNERGIITLTRREGSSLAIHNLHREAKIRCWDGPDFTVFPTYVIWPVEPYGILIRAYHQTVFALRVHSEDPAFTRGIERGTLDGTFTAKLANDERRTLAFATDSEKIQIFSLYETRLDSRLPPGGSREGALRKLLEQHVPPPQRRLAEAAIAVREALGGEARWRETALRSASVLRLAESAATFDAAAYARLENRGAPTPVLSRLRGPYRELAWRVDYLYRLLIAPLKFIYRQSRRTEEIRRRFGNSPRWLSSGDFRS